MFSAPYIVRYLISDNHNVFCYVNASGEDDK